jgi:DNA-binding CsgD family transcriptional regulator
VELVDWEGAASLTERELQVLRLTAHGLSAKEIAKDLNIAPRTVERHIDHIRLKTRTRNRSHMVAYAISSGCV